jgi:hypothetical protein
VRRLVQNNWAFGVLTALLALVLVGGGCGGGETTTVTTSVAPAPSAQEPTQKQKERQLDSEFDQHMKAVVPLLRQYEASPSPALAEKIGLYAPELEEISLKTGAVKGINEQMAREILSHYGE